MLWSHFIVAEFALHLQLKGEISVAVQSWEFKHWHHLAGVDLNPFMMSMSMYYNVWEIL